MRHDEDLLFLKQCNTKDLAVLVDYLTKDKDGSIRFSEELTDTDAYKKHYPHSLPQMWKEIANELQHFGGNTIMNFFRGEGRLYKDILCDVAKKLKVNFNKNSSVELIEQYLLAKVLIDSAEKLNDEELKVLIEELGVGNNNLKMTRSAMLAALQIAVKQSGFFVYKMSVVVANAVAKAILGRGLALAANAGVTRSIAIVAGPIGWAITAIWLLVDVASQAYRVTIPSVIQIAYMRQTLKYR